ncbi:MAG TPA: helix-turn-helix domain-containing protein [Gemmatimonadales bacterium]|nr:helix-turn-helix domain-containing protein [Candidatus Bathyarchaeia archaeon]HUL03474.1 helix-turn-helix domain-containing protein [Gemmatimonadales bacterium]
MTPRRVVMVAMPCAEVMEIGGTLDVFYAAKLLLAEASSSDPGYEVEVVSPVATIRSWPGLCIRAERSFRQVRGPIDTLIITGTDTPEDALHDADLIHWLKQTAPRTRRLVGMCTGTFVLAAAGLLDGRRATSHWLFCDDLTRRFPQVHVERDPIYVRDGAIYTGVGASAGLDLALALVEEDVGRRIALGVAKREVFFLKRPGGQAQFSVQLSTQMAEREPLRDLQAWIADHPAADLSVEALARRAAMSPRNFCRVFMREVGMTPGRFVERVRVEAARRLLEDSARGVPQVAAVCGFGSAETMRIAFRRALGVSPKVYRSRFYTTAST